MTVRRTGPRPPLYPAGRQLQVMAVLWKRQSGTVAEVMADLNDLWEPEIAYTTVLTYLRTLKRTGWVRTDTEGHADRYFPAATIDQVRRLALDDCVDLLFEGRREELFRWLIHDRLSSRRVLRWVRIVLADHLEHGFPARREATPPVGAGGPAGPGPAPLPAPRRA